MTSEQKQILEKQLWKIADELRGSMNADEYCKIARYVNTKLNIG